MPRSSSGSCCAESVKFWPCVSQPPIGQRDAADAGFDQAAGGQELLDAAVAVADARVFAAQVEGLADGAGGDHVEGAGGEGVHAVHGAGGVDVAADGVEAVEQAAAVVDAVDVDAARQAQVLAGRGRPA